MGSESEDLNFAMDHLRKMAEPQTALIITQNEAGEILDARVVDINEAMFLLRHGSRAQEAKAEKQSEAETQPSDSSWWSPAT